MFTYLKASPLWPVPILGPRAKGWLQPLVGCLPACLAVWWHGRLASTPCNQATVLGEAALVDSSLV